MKTYKDLLLRADEVKTIYSSHSIQYTVNYFESTDPIIRRVLSALEIPLHSKKDQIKFKNLETYGTEHIPKEIDAERIVRIKQTKQEKYGDSNYNNRNKAVKTQLDLYGGVGLGSTILKQKAKETCLDRYGTDNPAKSDIVKEHMKETCIKRFGTDCTFHSSDVIDKINKTCQERYNVTNRGSIPSRIQSAKETALKNWGKDNYCNRNKAKQTMQERYGVSYALQNEQIKQHASKIIEEKYGVHWNCMRDEARSHGSNNSGPNLEFEKLLNENSIEFSREFPLDNYSYDFKIGNILVEIDPAITHNSTWTPFGDNNGLPVTYHYDKTACANKYGYRCIHIWDWDNPNKIINLLEKRSTVYARNCIIEEVTVNEASNFINKIHLQNYARDSIRIALKYNDEIVSIMTFGKPRYNNNYEYELIRYCSSYNVVGGPEKLFNYFIKTYNPKSIVSYCDKSKFDGTIYSKLGFVALATYGPSKHWWSIKLHKHISNNLLIKHGFDRLFKTNFGKGTSNEELMLQHGFLEVYDCGQQTYTWNKNI